MLQWIVDQFTEDSTLDHLIVACDDWMTGQQILGVHAFSNRVWWEQTSENLFLDPSPRRPGKRVIIDKPSACYFLHSPDPSPYQAFHFGAHRALKITQPERSVSQKKTDAMQAQWDALYNAWKLYKVDRDRRRGLALIAAHLVISRMLDPTSHDYKNASLVGAFERYSAVPEEELFELLRQFWGSDDSRRSYYQLAVGADGLRKIAQDKRGRLGPGRLKTAGSRIKERWTYKLYRSAVWPHLDQPAKLKMDSDPVQFFRDAKHPVIRLGRWIHRRDVDA